MLTDCVPSKTLIATSSTMSVLHGAADLGIRSSARAPDLAAAPARARASASSAAGRAASVDAPRLYARVKALARAQSADVAARLAAEGVEVIAGRGALAGPHTRRWPATRGSARARC